MIYLKEANLQDAEKEWKFVAALPEDENGFGNSWPGISREDFEATALPVILAQAKGERLPKGWVPQTCFFLWDDDTIVGLYHLRQFLCESLVEGSGHIGYIISKEFRGKGYGTAGLGLVLDAARQIVPEEEFYLRVNRDNPASLKVMLKNGGYIHHEDAAHYYVRIRKDKG